ncbi:hypothetical protein XI03_02730 [Bradyrhizobium sp. CCBAU 65884]|nr:hypothetical protein [Bradyrhizobium sp. CCBAU 65884]
MFICMLVFDMTALELFPGLMSELHAAVLARVSELYEELQGDPSRAARLKLDFLEQLLERVEANRLGPTV